MLVPGQDTPDVDSRWVLAARTGGSEAPNRHIPSLTSISRLSDTGLDVSAALSALACPALETIGVTKGCLVLATSSRLLCWRRAHSHTYPAALCYQVWTVAVSFELPPEVSVP